MRRESSLGKTRVRYFLRFDAKAVISRNFEKLQVAWTLEKKTGRKLFVSCDVRNWNEIVAVNKNRKIDILVNNAVENFTSPNDKAYIAFDSIFDIVLKRIKTVRSCCWKILD